MKPRRAPPGPTERSNRERAADRAVSLIATPLVVLGCAYIPLSMRFGLHIGDYPALLYHTACAAWLMCEAAGVSPFARASWVIAPTAIYLHAVAESVAEAMQPEQRGRKAAVES